MKFANKTSHHIDAMNFMLFVSGIALVTCFLVILTVTSLPNPPEPEQVVSEPEATTQQSIISVEIKPTITLEVIP